MFDSIVAYTYNAEQLCVDCMHPVSVQIFRDAGGKVESMSVETNLDAAALYTKVNRQDEHTFDSDDFPKVVLSIQIDGCERCTRCGRHIDAEDCITYHHNYTYGGGRFRSAICQNGRCGNVGQGDPCGDGDCLWHPDNPLNPYQCEDWVDKDWCEHEEHQALECPEFAENGSCIHSDHMALAGL
jgi:hypothetical protein